MGPGMKRLGDLLVEDGILSPAKLEEALKNAIFKCSSAEEMNASSESNFQKFSCVMRAKTVAIPGPACPQHQTQIGVQVQNRPPVGPAAPILIWQRRLGSARRETRGRLAQLPRFGPRFGVQLHFSSLDRIACPRVVDVDTGRVRV